MKKTRVLGLALTLAASMVVGSAMGQLNTSTTNYVEIKASDLNNTRSFITEGKTLSYFAVPDLAYHASWNAAGNWKLNSGHIWTWTWDPASGLTIGGSTASPYSATATGVNNDPANSATIKAGTNLGEFAINVKESLSAALGGCGDPTGTNFKLVVFGKPTIDFDINGRAGKGINVPCTLPDTTLQIKIKGTESFNIQFRMQVYDVTVNPSTGATTETQVGIDSVFSGTKVANSGTITGGKGNRIVWTLSDGGVAFDYATTTANLDRTLTTAVTKFPVQPGKSITLYKFTINNAATPTADGINDFVSRKSDNGSGPSIYQGTTANQTLALYVKRAPITGPVYHISNNVAL